MQRNNYTIDHLSFNKYTKDSCYWAGFLAADGCISDSGNKFNECRYLTLGLQEGDKNQVLKFKDFLKCNKELAQGKKEQFINYNLTITSKIICEDLTSKFNITPRKSLTLQPPINIQNNKFIDCFIIGYIDGDGCIFLQDRKKYRNQKVLIISILGTLEILNFIKTRFEQILNKPLGTIIKRKRNNNKNTFVLSICSKTAREIFIHLYSKNIPKMNRKWKEEIYNYCINWKRNSSRESKIKKTQYA